MKLIEESQATGENRRKSEKQENHNGLIETVFFSLTLLPGYPLSDTNV